MTNILKLVLTDHWFEKIKSGHKTHEYRKATPFWCKRICNLFGMTAVNNSGCDIYIELPREYMPLIQFQKAYRKDPERMTFKIKNIKWLSSGLETDLKCIEPVFDIELGECIK